MVNLSNLALSNGRFFFLAYDQGLEHGPTDFNDDSVDPNYIINIAKKVGFSGIILQKGIAEKYYTKDIDIPLIMKLNGKTNLVNDEPFSEQLCSVGEALDLGASAVGYTIYVGSKYESLMFKEASKIIETAHDKNLPVITWMYPRGSAVLGKEKSRDILAYAARIGLELGADILKIPLCEKLEDFSWVVKNAGKAKVVVSGGKKREENILLDDLKSALNFGASGIAVGRNVWQDEEPLKISQEIKNILLPEPC